MEIKKLDSAECWYKVSFKGIHGYGSSIADAIENCLNRVQKLQQVSRQVNHFDDINDDYDQKMDIERSPVEFVTRD